MQRFDAFLLRQRSRIRAYLRTVHQPPERVVVITVRGTTAHATGKRKRA